MHGGANYIAINLSFDAAEFSAAGIFSLLKFFYSWDKIIKMFLMCVYILVDNLWSSFGSRMMIFYIF